MNINFNKLFQSKKIKIITAAVVAIIILLLAFKAGEFAGYRKARFSYRWAENYHRNFAGPRSGFFGPGGFLGDFSGKDFINPHGTFGQILKIDGNTLVVKGQDNTEKVVLISDKTIINKNRETIKPSDLKVDDRITVIGSPNDQGQIEAKLIRVFGAENAKEADTRSWFRFFR